MSYIDDLNAAAQEALAASSSATNSAQIMSDVANGGEDTTVTTAGGEVKSLAKAIKDIVDAIEAGAEETKVEPQTLSEGQTTVTLSTFTTEGVSVYVEGSREFDFTVVNSTDLEFGQSFPEGTRIWVVKRDIEGFVSLEESFETSMEGWEERFNQLLANTGYTGTGVDSAYEDYASGIEITEYNQVVRDSAGEFWRLSGSTSLPYTTDGTGLPESGAFVSVGDAALRNDLAGAPVNGAGALRVRGAVIYVDTIADLQALPVSGLLDGHTVKIVSTGRAGNFAWISNDLSLEVSEDTHQGFYIAPAEDLTGAQGAWVRQYSDKINAQWFGIIEGGSNDQSSRINETIDYLQDGDELFFTKGTYNIGGQGLVVSKRVNMSGGDGTSFECSNLDIDAYALSFINEEPSRSNYAHFRNINLLSLSARVSNGIYVENNGMYIKDCDIRGFGIGIALTRYGTTVRDCSFSSNHEGILVDFYPSSLDTGPVNHNYIDNCRMFNNSPDEHGAAISINSALALYISKCWFELNRSYDIYAERIESISVTKCWFEAIGDISQIPRIYLRGLDEDYQYNKGSVVSFTDCRIASSAPAEYMADFGSITSLTLSDIKCEHKLSEPKINLGNTNVIYVRGLIASNSYPGVTTIQKVQLVGGQRIIRENSPDELWPIGGILSNDTTNTIKDSSFVNGVSLSSPGDPVLYHDTSTGFSDNYSCRIEFPAGNRGLANTVRSSSIALAPGNNVLASMWIISNRREPLVLSLLGADQLFRKYFFVTEEWTKIEINQSFPDDVLPGNYLLALGSELVDETTGPLTVWIDDVVYGVSDGKIDGGVPSIINHSQTVNLEARKGINLPSYNIGPIRVSYGDSIPTAGEFIKGDVIYNTNPSAEGFAGWICITSGSPGIWKGFGVIEA